MSAPASLVDQLFMRAEAAGRATHVVWVVDLAGQVSETDLRQSLAAALSEVPRLNSRVEVRRFTCVRVDDGARREANEQILETAAPDDTIDDLLACLTVPAGAVGRPYRIWLMQRASDEGGHRLVVAARHSVTDALGLQFFIDRWGEHYRSITQEHALPPAPLSRPAPIGLGWMMRQLPLRDRVRCLLSASGALPIIRNIFVPPPSIAMATFLDKPLPCTGVLRHLRRTIDYQAYRDILYWAVDRKLSPLDVFLVAICEAGLEIWPNQADLSIVISVPVDLRKTGDCDVANRVAAYNVVLPPGSSSDRERLIKAAAHSSQKLRNKSAAIAQLMKKALFVFLPVSLTTNLIKRQDANQINTYETTTFAFLEPFGSRLTAFGGVAIDNAYLLGGVGAPPGFRLALSPAAKKLNLTITFLDPAMGLETAENFIDCIVGRVRSIIKYKRDN